MKKKWKKKTSNWNIRDKLKLIIFYVMKKYIEYNKIVDLLCLYTRV